MSNIVLKNVAEVWRGYTIPLSKIERAPLNPGISGGGVISNMYYYLTPEFIGSVYEHRSGDIIVRDALTGTDLTKEYTIHHADAKAGYFVVQEHDDEGATRYVTYNLPITIEKL